MSQTCDFLPYSQVQAPQFQVHISYFLQNCKKGKPPKKDLPFLKTISQVLSLFQNSGYIAVNTGSGHRKRQSQMTLPSDSVDNLISFS